MGETNHVTYFEYFNVKMTITNNVLHMYFGFMVTCYIG